MQLTHIYQNIWHFPRAKKNKRTLSHILTLLYVTTFNNSLFTMLFIMSVLIATRLFIIESWTTNRWNIHATNPSNYNSFFQFFIFHYTASFTIFISTKSMFLYLLSIKHSSCFFDIEFIHVHSQAYTLFINESYHCYV